MVTDKQVVDPKVEGSTVRRPAESPFGLVILTLGLTSSYVCQPFSFCPVGGSSFR